MCLDDAVGRFLPAFATNEKGAITVRHILSHASGLPPWVPCYCDAQTLEETVAVIAAVELEARPGAQVRYSDAGMILLRAIVREVTGEDLPELLTREVFKPLGMHDTMYQPPEETPDPCRRHRTRQRS